MADQQQALVSTTPAAFFMESGLTAQEAVSRAGAGAVRRRFRVGLKKEHPAHSETYGGVSFPKVTEMVSDGGRRRIPRLGGLVSLSEVQVRRVLDDAKHKVCRVYGDPHDPVRHADLDVRRIGLGGVSPGDRPVLMTLPDGSPDWANSLIYMEENPVEDAPAPADYFEAIERLRQEQLRGAASPLATGAPPAFQAPPSADAAKAGLGLGEAARADNKAQADALKGVQAARKARGDA